MYSKIRKRRLMKNLKTLFSFRENVIQKQDKEKMT